MSRHGEARQIRHSRITQDVEVRRCGRSQPRRDSQIHAHRCARGIEATVLEHNPGLPPVTGQGRQDGRPERAGLGNKGHWKRLTLVGTTAFRTYPQQSYFIALEGPARQLLRGPAYARPTLGDFKQVDAPEKGPEVASTQGRRNVS